MPLFRSHFGLGLVAAALAAAVALLPDGRLGAGAAVPDQLSLGIGHSCARTATNDVLCWGENEVGQLGDGTIAARPKPGPVLGLGGDVAQIALGGHHSCALLADGGAQCWGWNRYGQLGNGRQNPPAVPEPVPLDVVVALAGARLTGIDEIAAGGVHTCALMATGGVKCWGWNAYGQVGAPCESPCLLPINVSGLTSGVAALGLGANHSCAVMALGGVKCWGRNDSGQLGAATAQTCGTPPLDRPCSTTPIDVAGLTDVSQVTAGNDHTCALTVTGGVKCWGDNTRGQLGDGQACGATCGSPVDVSGLTSGVSAIAAGEDHTCALTMTGGVKCWGDNTSGQLGDGQTCATICPSPVDVAGLIAGVDAVDAGGDHTCALPGSGGVVCWGANDRGQLGDGSHTNRALPAGVLGLGAGPDSDGDGCANDRELGPDELLGGRRDPNYFWDFFDVPAGSPLVRDGAVAAPDIAAVVARFGSNDAVPGAFDRYSGPLSAPNAPITPSGARQNYHPAFDRGGSIPGQEPWDLRPPNGAIEVGDIAAAVTQFGHTCL